MIGFNPSQLQQLSPIERIEAEEARRDFKLFVKLAWHVIEPGRPFVPGWHLDAIAEHLRAVTHGQIKRLLINMPPRHGKSTLISVLWPVWSWLSDPSLRWLCASYAMNLATRDNLKCRRIIKSPWFQDRYGHVFTLTKDQDAKTKFENDHMGYRMAVSVGSSATGEGGDILLGDDFHNIDEKESDAKRESALDWFDNTWSTRLNDQQNGAMVAVGQRIHEKDVSGHILDTNDGEWVHLNLPAEYDPGSACRTYLFSKHHVQAPSDLENQAQNDVPLGKCLFWADPRQEEGELLWEARFPRAVIEKAKKRHGVLGYSALYGQRPIPPGGYVFNKANERLFTISPQSDVYQLITPSGIKIVPVSACWELTTSDVAVKDKEQNDFTVFAHWAITPENDVLLLDIRRGHWLIPKQKEQARLFYRVWYSPRYKALYFEDVGYQSAIGQDLLTEGIPCLAFHPKGDKVQRAVGASIWQEAGKVYFLKGASWLEDFRDEIYKFPKTRNDDQVDPFSMVCMIVRSPDIEELDEEITEALHSYVGY
jgi:predicted phage terminase large subunit-like protein